MTNNKFNVLNWLKNIYLFFKDGFSEMTVGRTLWAIALIKLFIMFAILRVFFFPNYLNSKFEKEQDKADYVGTKLYEKSNVTPESSDN